MKTIAIIGCGKSTVGKEGWAIGHAHAHGYRACGHEVKLLGVDTSGDARGRRPHTARPV